MKNDCRIIDLLDRNEHFKHHSESYVKHKVIYPLHRRFNTSNNLLITGMNICNNQFETKPIQIKFPKNSIKQKEYKAKANFNINLLLNSLDQFFIKEDLHKSVDKIDTSPQERRHDIQNSMIIHNDVSIKKKKEKVNKSLFPREYFALNYYYKYNKKEIKKAEKRKEFLDHKVVIAFENIKNNVALY